MGSRRTNRRGSVAELLVAAATAQRLVETGARAVGIDSVNIDAMHDMARPVHTALLRAGIPIIEHLTNLAAVPDGRRRFTAVPPPLRGVGTFAVRAYVTVDNEASL